MKRAITDVDHIFRLREEKPSLSNLIKQGAVGEDLWERLLNAERELDIEVQEVPFTGHFLF
jgi:translocation protein SEC66